MLREVQQDIMTKRGKARDRFILLHGKWWPMRSLREEIPFSMLKQENDTLPDEQFQTEECGNVQ